MYPARIPPIETTASGRGRGELELPTRAVSTNRLANESQGERTLPETRMFRNKLNMNNLRLSIVDVSPKSYEVRFLRIAKTQIAAKDEDQQNMDCGLYWNWQIQQRRHLSASLILTTLAR